MAKKVAIMAVNPVNGFGLFQYLEAFYENEIPYKTFAVADTREIRSNSGVAMTMDDVIANLKGREDEYGALVFACGDAIPVFGNYANEQYNKDMMEVIAAFGAKGKILIGHCAGGMMFDKAGVVDGRRVSTHPLAKGGVQKGIATDEKFEVDGNIYTAQTENTVWMMMPEVLKALK